LSPSRSISVPFLWTKPWFSEPLGPRLGHRNRPEAQVERADVRPPASRTRACSAVTSSASPASPRGSSGCPQESPNGPQVPPRNGRAPPLPFPRSRVARRGRAEGTGRLRGPALLRRRHAANGSEDQKERRVPDLSRSSPWPYMLLGAVTLFSGVVAFLLWSRMTARPFLSRGEEWRCAPLTRTSSSGGCDPTRSR
jgi:hypothetical protein